LFTTKKGVPMKKKKVSKVKARAKKVVLSDDKTVFSCRLSPEQQELVFAYDKVSCKLGKKPSLMRALDQMLIELGDQSVGYYEESTRPPRKKATTKLALKKRKVSRA
jgi:hypothetical protein